jgi:hypothetical protein
MKHAASSLQAAYELFGVPGKEAAAQLPVRGSKNEKLLFVRGIEEPHPDGGAGSLRA